MIKVLITGGTGLVGRELSKKIQKKGYEVVILSRNPKNKNEYRWDVSKDYIDQNVFKNVTHIIHLAGAGIAEKRWSEKQKKNILDSRVKTANLLFKKVKEYNIPIRKFISASGVGYYGAITTDLVYKETDSPHSDFIAKVCVDWEDAVKQFNQLDISTTILRTGVVLAKHGSALQKINTPVFLSALGSGKQYFPWIHIEDLCNLYLKAIEEDDFTGVFNAVSPNFHTNEYFTKVLGKTLSKIVTLFNVPAFMMRLLLGEMSVILLHGSKVSCEKTNKYYSFKYPGLKECLDNLYE